MSAASGETRLGKAKDHPGQVKETLISLIIAFVMAFVFRAFVAEAFIIPTGSMAPTLLGAHTRHQAAATGSNWPVNPPNQPTPATYTAEVQDPMSGQVLRETVRKRAGDRILVFKYLYSVYDPKRWDVVVFKAPDSPQTNFIKRLAALPGEEPAIVDGDVFTRKAQPPQAGAAAQNTWVLPGWEIKRKPERVQREVWQDVFWSQHEPILPVTDDHTRMPFRSPWKGGTAGWQIDGRQSYLYSGDGPTVLEWDSSIRRITDEYAYNRQWPTRTFPVSDINMALGFEPRGEAGRISAVIETRGHEFRADIEGGAVTLRMAPVGGDPAGTLRTIGTGSIPAVTPGTVLNLEFWHVDQSLQLWANGELVASGSYDWSLDERLRYTTGMSAADVYAEYAANFKNQLPLDGRYPAPEVRWEFSGGAFELHRVGLQRDVHYQAGIFGPGPRVGEPARATHPASSLILGPDHFFVLGDNSPLSADARLWDAPNPWVSELIDPADGVIPRDLLIGRAFFVYFPALTRGGLGIPVPDFGRLRWIW